MDEFALPEGDAERGRAAFVALGCTGCHSADRAEHDTSAGTGIHYPLGGALEYEKTYVDLVTSVINPSHRIARAFGPTSAVVDGREVSRMRVFNEVMTVQQLTDIVTYLAPQYRITALPYYAYPEYPYPY